MIIGAWLAGFGAGLVFYRWVQGLIRDQIKAEEARRKRQRRHGWKDAGGGCRYQIW